MPGIFALALLLAPAEVEWQAPEGCPSGGEFVARVSDPAFRVAVDVEALAEGKWRAELTMTREGSVDERRVIEGETCQAVADAAVLIVQLRSRRLEEPAALVPPVEAPPSSPAEPPQPTEVPRDEPAIEDPPEPAAASVQRRPHEDEPTRGIPLGGWLALSGGLAAGVLPGVGGAAALEGGVDGPRWRVGLAARLFPERTQRGVSADGRFTLMTAGGLGCYAPRYRSWAFPACGRVDVGALRGEGRNAEQTEVAWPLWAGVSASGSAQWWVSERVVPFVTLEGTASLAVPAFSDGRVEGAFFRAGRWGVRAWLGFEIRLKKGPQKR